MFTDHFQMTGNPFTENPPDKWLLCDERFEQALARAYDAARNRLLDRVHDLIAATPGAAAGTETVSQHPA